MKTVLTACIPALTVVFGWALNKAVSIANGYINNKFAQNCLQNAANAVFNAVQYVNQTYVDALKEADKFDENAQCVAYNRALAAAKKALTQETRAATPAFCASSPTLRSRAVRPCPAGIW